MNPLRVCRSLIVCSPEASLPVGRAALDCHAAVPVKKNGRRFGATQRGVTL
jgi:hypothetical protein